MTEPIIISIITGICVILASAIAAYYSRETHKAVNGRLDAFLEMAKKSFKAEGKLEGKAEAKSEAKYPHRD